MNALNPQQKAVIESTAQTTVVIAGPGSGKTTVLVHRIADSITHGTNPAKIVVVTFSNAAAREIAQRLERINIVVGYVGTIHGWCFRLLQKHGSRIGYRKGGNITIITEDIREQLILKVRDTLGYKSLSLKSIEEGSGFRAVEVKAEYAAELKRQNMVDYDGILTQSLKLLRSLGNEKPDVEDLYGDEMQDSKQVDWDILNEIPGRKTFVGDTDQSVYGFRGACPEILIQQSMRPEVLTFKLERNYRSTIDICHAANTLIQHNTQRIAKTINPDATGRGIVNRERHGSMADEASSIVYRFKCLNAPGSIPWEEMAVLARTNDVADYIRTCFIDRAIPVEQNAAPRLPQDWTHCLTTLQLMQDQHNNILCERYLLACGWGRVSINTALLESMKTGRPLHTVAGLPSWSTSLDGLPQRLAQAGVSAESVGLVGERIFCLPMDRPTFADLVSDLWNSNDWKAAEKRPGVFVGTIHAAKGREWDAVAVVAMEEGVLPSLSKSSSIEEERRLAFVAITRARKILILSHSTTRFSFGRRMENQQSRFLTEIKDLA